MTPKEYRIGREKIGTQSEAADVLGVSLKTVQRLEAGRARITEEHVRGLLKAIEELALDVAIEPTVPVVDAPIPGRRMDSTSKHESPDTLTANIMHWYVEPGYVLRRRDEKK